jgi:hypothetical protein
MKDAVEMGSVALIYEYIPSFINIGSGVQILIEGYKNTQTGWRSPKPILGK